MAPRRLASWDLYGISCRNRKCRIDTQVIAMLKHLERKSTMSDPANVMPETESVGLFKVAASLQAAVNKPLLSGFKRDKVRLVTSDDAIEEKLHRHYRTVSELEDDAAVPRSDYFAPESMGDALRRAYANPGDLQ